MPSKHSPHSKIKEGLALYYLLELRKAGATYKQLAEIFNCDFSTVYYHCRRHDIRRDYRWNTSTLRITPNIIFILTGRLTVPIEPVREQWYVIGSERINRGKSYREYLEEQKRHG